MAEKRLIFFDYIKALSIIFVVITHTTVMPQSTNLFTYVFFINMAH